MNGVLFVLRLVFWALFWAAYILALFWAVYKSYPTKKDVKGSEE